MLMKQPAKIEMIVILVTNGYVNIIQFDILEFTELNYTGVPTSIKLPSKS